MNTHEGCRSIAPAGSGLLVLPGFNLLSEQIHHGEIRANWTNEQTPPPMIPLLALEATTFGYTEPFDIAAYIQRRGHEIDPRIAQASLDEILEHYGSRTDAQAADKAFWGRDLLFVPQKHQGHRPDNTMGVLASLASDVNIEPILHTAPIVQVRRYLDADTPAHMVRRGYEKRVSKPRPLIDFPAPPWTSCTIFATDSRTLAHLDPIREAAVRAQAETWHTGPTRSLRDSEIRGESRLASTLCAMIALQEISPPTNVRNLPGEAARAVLPYIACDVQIADIARRLGISQNAVTIRAELARKSGPYKNAIHTLAGMFALHLFVTAVTEH